MQEEVSVQGQWWLLVQPLHWSQVCLSLYVSHVSWATIFLSKTKVSVCEQEFVLSPFKRMPGFPAAFHLTGTDGGIPFDFYSQMLCALLLVALAFWARELIRLRPLTLQGELLQLRCLSILSTATYECEVRLYHISSLPTMASSLYH